MLRTGPSIWLTDCNAIPIKRRSSDLQGGKKWFFCCSCSCPLRVKKEYQNIWHELIAPRLVRWRCALCCLSISAAEQKGPYISDCRLLARGRNTSWFLNLPIPEVFLIIKGHRENYNSVKFSFLTYEHIAK